MTPPWQAEFAIADDLARQLIDARFPSLAPARLHPLGAGWDNSAYVVNGEWVFRFPRRPLGVELLESELRVLPLLAPHVPLPVPVPCFKAHGDERYPHPFAGYRMLSGRTADAAELDSGQRFAAAPRLGSFLRALHAIPAGEALARGAPGDTLGRLRLDRVAGMVRERTARLVAHGLIDSDRYWSHVLDEAPYDRTPARDTIVHGDLYARHVLVDRAGLPCGVIDWGDVHVGDRALDFTIAHALLPPQAHAAFRAAYGDIDEAGWCAARLRALHISLAIVLYGHETGDEPLRREGWVGLRFLARD